MELAGRYPFPAPPLVVWETICDPAALKQCIPQCESIERVSDTEWRGTAKVKIGPVSVPFEGFITLSNVKAPESYTLTIVAKSWMGSSQGSADVVLSPDGAGTMLDYKARVSLGIKLLDKAMEKADKLAKHLADAFFARLAEVAKGRAK